MKFKVGDILSHKAASFVLMVVVEVQPDNFDKAYRIYDLKNQTPEQASWVTKALLHDMYDVSKTEMRKKTLEDLLK
jgi:hypothetical protein